MAKVVYHALVFPSSNVSIVRIDEFDLGEIEIVSCRECVWEPEGPPLADTFREWKQLALNGEPGWELTSSELFLAETSME